MSMMKLIDQASLRDAVFDSACKNCIHNWPVQTLANLEDHCLKCYVNTVLQLVDDATVIQEVADERAQV